MIKTTMNKNNIFKIILSSALIIIFLVGCSDKGTGISNSISSSDVEVSSSADNTQEDSIMDSSSSQLPASSDDYIPLPEGYFHSYEGSEANKENSMIGLYSITNSYLKFTGYEVYVDGEKTDLYKVMTNNTYVFSPNNFQRDEASVISMRMEGKADFVIRTPFSLNGEASLKPLSHGICPVVNENLQTISFTLYNSGQYTLEINGSVKNVLHIFINSYEKVFDSYKTAENTIYFGPGIHDSSNDARINQNGKVYIESGQTVVVDYQAVVRAGFVSYGEKEIKLIGGGIIDGSVFERDSSKGTRLIPVDFEYCEDVLISGLTFLDPAGWCLNLYFQNMVRVDNIKIITSRANGDGISVQSCQNVNVTNSFVRTFDDSLVVKNYPYYDDHSHEGTTSNISFDNCLIWTDLAQSMEIGYETIGETMENINFSNITILHALHKAPISIHNANNANIKNISYTNITIDDPSMGKGDGENIFIDIEVRYSSTWSDNWVKTSLGSITGVSIKNILVRGTKSNLPIIIQGTFDNRDNTEHYVNNVLMSDILINGNKIDSLYRHWTAATYVKGSYFTNTSSDVTGADLELENTSSTINNDFSTYAEISIY